jgi:hypothetical protein
MPLPHLLQALKLTQQTIEDLENAAAALRRSMAGADSTPIRQRHLDAVATLLATARAEAAHIEGLIEELERGA